MNPIIKSFFHVETATFTHIIIDPDSHHAAIVDPVLDYAIQSGHTGTVSAEEVAAYITAEALQLDWVLETHAHADHLSAAPYFKKRFGAKVAIGSGISKVQQTFEKIFNFAETLDSEKMKFDHLFEDEDVFSIGELQARAMATPGHTSDSISYLVGNTAFIGDTLFMPDYGTARCDFPGGDARQFYHSVQRIFSLPENTRLYVCHDYIPEGINREHTPYATVAEQKLHNVHLNKSISEDEFVMMRELRDKTLDLPKLIIPSIQVNIRAGEMPLPEANGIAYLKVPVNIFGQ